MEVEGGIEWGFHGTHAHQKDLGNPEVPSDDRSHSQIQHVPESWTHNAHSVFHADLSCNGDQTAFGAERYEVEVQGPPSGLFEALDHIQSHVRLLHC